MFTTVVVAILQSLIGWETYCGAGLNPVPQETNKYETRIKTLLSHGWYAYHYI